MNMRKTRLLVKHYDPIGKKYELIKPLGYVLEGSYCAYKMINASIDAPRSIYWEVTDAKSGIIILRAESLKVAIAVFVRYEKKRFEEWKDNHKEEYEKCCEEIEELNATELRKEIEE